MNFLKNVVSKNLAEFSLINIEYSLIRPLYMLRAYHALANKTDWFTDFPNWIFSETHRF